MALDPYLGGVLKMLADAGRKPTWQGTPEEGRAGYIALTVDARSPEQIVPVGSTTDTTVPGPAGPIKARIYRPEGDGPFPTVAFFHGGGYVIGDLETHDNMCRAICRGAQAVVMAFDYRLAPEHRFPAGIEDAIVATRWVQAHARELGGTDTVAVAGDSAGGNFSAVIAQQLRGSTPALAAQFLIYPATDTLEGGHASMQENASGYLLEMETMKWFFDHYTGGQADTNDPRLAPIRAADLAGLPPALIVTAEFDPLRDEGEAYARALQAAGNHAEVIRCDGMIHAFFDMGHWSPAAQQYIDKAVARFGEILRAG